MCLEIKDSIVTKCPKNLFGSLKTDHKEKPCIFWEINIPESTLQIFGVSKYWFPNRTALRKNTCNSSEDKNMQELVK